MKFQVTISEMQTGGQFKRVSSTEHEYLKEATEKFFQKIEAIKGDVISTAPTIIVMRDALTKYYEFKIY